MAGKWKLYTCNNKENCKKYAIAKKDTKKVASEANNEAFEHLYR